ncbi:hypothetical protein M409DRAFT_56928 [Zasmidium cellare ATCC 36951]|uniref:Translation initiation inhibitor n=1 Tax=Zasmidium cellare ATCC 36951 TaxID=1080233 RepID=A0A6A6CB27_ZASCE|nr:uncharacterized protein M409DRAFT_56928 [Zasmidium cellare ATCC 36951]KAF2164241.1 hypothetical protein M409DRAFT_56928 [Zasmidium cellare ATCC 36951]
MSHLQYKSYPGFGEWNFENFHYSSAVRIAPGEQIQISGQGGWTRDDGKVKENLAEEFAQAFENVNYTIKYAGGKGMSAVYKLAVYYAPVTEEALNETVVNLRKWFPDHRPLLTAIGVEKLAAPGMRFEIEAWAHVE